MTHPPSETLVYVIEDDEAVLDSIAMLLARQGHAVSRHLSAEAFLSVFDPEHFGCIVSDIRMPGMSGLALVEELQRRRTPHPVILITGHGDIEMAVTAIKAGAFDFIEKPFTDDRLLAGVHGAVAKGLADWRDDIEVATLLSRLAELSNRQREVMDLVIQGFVNKEIAKKLGISPRTVEIYRAWVMEKMGARTLADLVRTAMRIEQVRKGG